MVIAIPSASMDFLLGVVDRRESMSILALLAKHAVERFNDGALRRLAAAVESELGVARIRLQAYVSVGRLRFVVAGISPRQTAPWVVGFIAATTFSAFGPTPTFYAAIGPAADCLIFRCAALACRQVCMRL